MRLHGTTEQASWAYSLSSYALPPHLAYISPGYVLSYPPCGQRIPPGISIPTYLPLPKDDPASRSESSNISRRCMAGLSLWWVVSTPVHFMVRKLQYSWEVPIYCGLHRVFEWGGDSWFNFSVPCQDTLVKKVAWLSFRITWSFYSHAQGNDSKYKHQPPWRDEGN